MGKVSRIKINQNEVRKLLQGAQVSGKVREETSRIARAAGPGFEGSVRVVGGSTRLGRTMGYVTPVTAAARRRQARDNVLQKVIGGR